MKEANKTKKELLSELSRMRQRVAQLEESETRLMQVKDTLKKNLAKLSKKNRYETIISTIIRAIHNSINFKDVLENAVDAMSQNIDGVDSVSIYLVDGKEAILKAHRGYPDWFIEQKGTIPYPKGLTWKTIIDGKLTYCADAEKDKVIGNAEIKVGTKSYASIPIRFEGKIFGVINVNSSKKNSYDNKDLKLLDTVCKQIEIAFKNARKAELLRQSEERFRLAVESSPNAIVIVDQGGKIKLVNTQTERMFGYFRRELIGQSVELLVPESFRNKHIEYRHRFLLNPAARPMGAGRDLYALRKDGTVFPIEIGLSPIHTNEGITILGSIIDISQRKIAEEELRKEKGRAQKYLDVAEIILLAINNKEEVTLINKKGCRLLGYKEEEIIGMNWFDNFLPEKARAETRAIFQNLMTGEIKPAEYHENCVVTKSGEERLIAWHNTFLTDDTGKITGTLSSGEDITEKRLSEQVLQESEQKLQAILDNTTDAVLVYDQEGKVITANKEARRLFCWKHRTDLENMWEIIPPEDRDTFHERLKNVREGSNLLDCEMNKILENGERISVSVGLSYMERDGGMFFETIRDTRERVTLRNKIVELEKAQVLGKMAEGVAHHMGTPLASMLLRVQMLKEDIVRIENYRNLMDKLESIEKQIFYGQKVMQRLLKFASKPETEKRPEKISNIIEESIDIIAPLCKKPGIKLDLSIDNDMWVMADVGLFELVFTDIMMNAIDAMPEGGKIYFNVSNGSQEGFIDITISDTGTGIPEETLPLVFEPFFSTKPAGKGTGLGLSVAKRVIQDHGGKISIESTEGEGTMIYITIPIYSMEDEIERI
ncbi:MAG: PAS domain S-box protein [Deltaproteobacteria bacterium]|nr:PAS domain S-box protein [Deltaproteobacteria bacterium]